MGVICISRPVWVQGHCRINPPHFVAKCHSSFVLLYFRLSALFDLYLVFVCLFSCTPLFVSQVIGCEDRLRNDLYFVSGGALNSTHSLTVYQ